MKEHFKTELVKIEEKNKEDTIHAKVILDCIPIPESYDKSYFDQKYEWNKIINICKIDYLCNYNLHGPHQLVSQGKLNSSKVDVVYLSK